MWALIRFLFTSVGTSLAGRIGKWVQA